MIGQISNANTELRRQASLMSAWFTEASPCLKGKGGRENDGGWEEMKNYCTKDQITNY